MDPSSGINILHNLHVQFLGFHVFTLALNSESIFEALMFWGSITQVLGPLYLAI